MKTDVDLVKGVLEGNQGFYNELVKRHQKLMMKVAFRVVKDEQTAADIVQEAFIKAYQKLNTFAGRASFRSWLYQITLNTARNKIRGAKEYVSPDDFNWEVPVESKAEEHVFGQAFHEHLVTEVDKLPERQQMALRLRVFDDLSFREIADIMKCPYDTAKANYRHALLKLRERLMEAHL